MFNLLTGCNADNYIIASVYGGNFTPSEETMRRREQKVQECITLMGDKYRLANPITRKDNAK